MKFIKIGLILLTAALFAFACNQNQITNTNTINTTNNAVVAANNNPQPSATLGELAAARKHYSELCVKCHKEDGIGGISEIDGKRIKSPNFTSERMMKDDDADWIEAIRDGIPDDGMPGFKDKLSEQEIKDLVKLIRKDFQKK
jgi:mono/diheme cytochrome c family protein